MVRCWLLSFRCWWLLIPPAAATVCARAGYASFNATQSREKSLSLGVRGPVGLRSKITFTVVLSTGATIRTTMNFAIADCPEGRALMIALKPQLTFVLLLFPGTVSTGEVCQGCAVGRYRSADLSDCTDCDAGVC